MSEYANLHGLKETVAALRALPAEFASTRGGPIRGALFKAAKVIRDDAIARAPVDTGNLKANIYAYRERDPKGSTGATERYIVGIRSKRGQQARVARSRLNRSLMKVGRRFALKGDAWYGRLVEFGTQKMPARPFMRPAFEANKERAVQVFSEAIKRGVEAAEKRAKVAAGA